MTYPIRTLGLALSLFSLLAVGCSDSDEKDSDDTGVPVDAGNATDNGYDTADPGEEATDTVLDDTTPEAGADADPDAAADADADLPDGLRIPGLSQATTVYVDDVGIPHASCANDEDCAAVLGYFHARDRFAQMDLRRRVTTGRLTQLVGELALDNSISNRLLYSTPDGQPAEESLVGFATDKTMALLEAYANGVNAWLDDVAAGRNGAEFPGEYNYPLVSVDILPRWTPQDSVATVLALINQLTNDSGRELGLGERYALLDADTAFDLFGPMPATDTTVMSDYEFPKSSRPAGRLDPSVRARLVGAVPALRAAREVVGHTRFFANASQEDPGGSNNWVISPALTSGGNALLSNDPHLGMTNPSIWYYAHLDATTDGDGDYNVAGQSFAGLPWIVIGQNESIAWGATNTYFDQSDVYIETLSEDGSGVIFDGEVVPFVEHEYTFDLADADPVTETLRWVPHHGPVLSMDEEAGTAISLMWTGNRVSTDVNFLTELQRATNVEEAKTALTHITSIGQNWVVIDLEGNIGWFPYNHVPQRPWAGDELPSFLPLPGDGSAEWGDPVPYEALPQLYNPEAGYIATANNDMTGALHDGDPNNDGSTPLQVFSATGFRASRIVELLESVGPHDLNTMQEIVSDVHSLVGERITPAILAAVEGTTDDLTPAGQAVYDALAAWDFQCPTGLVDLAVDSDPDPDAAVAASSIGCSAFHALLGRLRARALRDEAEIAGVTRTPKTEALVHLLTDPDRLRNGEAYWDDVSTADVEETAADIVAASLDVGGEFLVESLGEDPDAWRWGRLHTITLRADLFDDAGVVNYNNGPYANDGGLYTVDVASPDSLTGEDFSHNDGPSTRFVCEALPTGPSCTVQLPGGQRHYPDADNYDDLFRRWLVNAPTPLIFDIATAATSATEELTFHPAD